MDSLVGAVCTTDEVSNMVDEILVAQEKRSCSKNMPFFLTLSFNPQAVGYTDTGYFCSLFKLHEKLTPSEFRGLFQ